MENPIAVSRVLRLGDGRERPVPTIVRRDREARLYLNPHRRLPHERFAHLKISHD
jgi:hypothetical protein